MARYNPRLLLPSADPEYIMLQVQKIEQLIVDIFIASEERSVRTEKHWRLFQELRLRRGQLLQRIDHA